MVGNSETVQRVAHYGCEAVGLRMLPEQVEAILRSLIGMGNSLQAGGNEEGTKLCALTYHLVVSQAKCEGMKVGSQ